MLGTAGLPRVVWAELIRNDSLRKLYAFMPILFLGATTNGYDGSLLNGLQTLESWQTRKDHQSVARRGPDLT